MTCELCGAPLPAEGQCPFNVSEQHAPWKGDYEAMAKKAITHQQHQVSVARWLLHNPAQQSQKALQHARDLAQRNIAVAIPQFPIVIE